MNQIHSVIKQQAKFPISQIGNSLCLRLYADCCVIEVIKKYLIIKALSFFARSLFTMQYFTVFVLCFLLSGISNFHGMARPIPKKVRNNVEMVAS